MRDHYYAARMPERELQNLVGALCKTLGLPMFHVLHPTGMEPGWPDCVVVGTRILYRELKTQTGRVSPEQKRVGQALKDAGADFAIWRPGDWLDGRIERELRLLRPPATLFDGATGAQDGTTRTANRWDSPPSPAA
jgi:hypothetical protein